VRALHERVDLLLHQYLSPEVARTLIEDPARAALGGMEVDVTVLFADLRGYTAFAERRSPAEVVAMLNAAFGVSVPIVLEEGGTVVQFMGDAVMAVFNAPSPQPDHARRAARSALAMQRAVLSLPDPAGRPKFRIGINSGPALVGNIGAADIRNFSANPVPRPLLTLGHDAHIRSIASRLDGRRARARRKVRAPWRHGAG